jgi:hypothetical protein
VTCLLSFTRCLACFGGPVKDGTRSDKQLAHRPGGLQVLECEIGVGPDRVPAPAGEG